MMKMNQKSKSALLSVISNIFLIISKLFIGFFTGSASVISDGVHSLVDLGTSIMTLFCVKMSDKPADKEHNYGHGKIDDISGLVSGIFIFITGVLIIIVAINKIMNPVLITHIDIAFIVMVVSTILNLSVSLHLGEMAKQYDSMALRSESLHKLTDVVSSAFISIGLFLVWLTHIILLDQILTIIIGLWICYESIDILKKSINNLIDSSLSQEDIDVIINILNKYKDDYCKYYDLKTRKSGSQKYMEINLIVKEDFTIKQVTKLCQIIEKDINDELKNIDILIQVESNCNDKLVCKASNKNRLRINFLYKNFKK